MTRLKCFVQVSLYDISEVRGAQALLYQRLMKQTCTVDLLQTHKQYLNVDIKLGEYCTILIWAASRQNQQNGMCTQRRLRSAWASPSLIRVFAVRMKKAWVLSYPLSAQRKLWSDWADAQADLRLCWVHSHLVGFVMRGLSFHTDRSCQTV